MWGHQCKSGVLGAKNWGRISPGIYWCHQENYIFNILQCNIKCLWQEIQVRIKTDNFGGDSEGFIRITSIPLNKGVRALF